MTGLGPGALTKALLALSRLGPMASWSTCAHSKVNSCEKFNPPSLTCSLPTIWEIWLAAATSA